MEVIITLFMPLLMICATNGDDVCVVVRHPPLPSLEQCLEKVNEAEETLNEIQDGSFFVMPSCILIVDEGIEV